MDLRECILFLYRKFIFSDTAHSNFFKMTSYTINSTAKLNSGYEIPRLGFGVYQT